MKKSVVEMKNCFLFLGKSHSKEKRKHCLCLNYKSSNFFLGYCLVIYFFNIIFTHLLFLFHHFHY